MFKGFSIRGSPTLRTLNFRLLPKRHSKCLQKRPRLIVIPGGRYDRYIHSPGLIDLVEIDLRKDQLFANPQSVITAAVERFCRDSAKIANARKSDRDQAIKKFEHPFAAKSHHRPNAHSLPQLERRDRFLGL